MAIFKPPHNIALRDHSKKSVFLAGSIEMGVSENWQEKAEKFLFHAGYNVFNPRRDNWDSSWEQNFQNPQFYQQVNWELDALEKADLIILYLSPETKSPISLLEMGIHIKSGKLHVVCPSGFWRKGNVEITCNRYNVPLYDNLETLLDVLK